MKKLIAIVVVTFASMYAGPAAATNGGHCIPPFGYIESCGMVCGQPGTCVQMGPGYYCLLTSEGYGCFDGTDDPCCPSGPSF